ncbi:DUF4114 domain-containing protein [Desulfobacterales bacterium HSG16]|nr:DUF4114 domain-containing protein [Desulfobacterales bacterium HSG16]
MKKFMRILMAMTMVSIMMCGVVSASPFNLNRPYGDIFSNPNEPNLQNIFDERVKGLDAVADQSNAAIWTSTEADVDSYLVSALRGHNGTLGVYSYATGAEYDFSFEKSTASFLINDAGALWFDKGGVDIEEIDPNFGHAFGFYWENTTANTISYTEDSKNNGNILALAYHLDAGTEVNPIVAGGFSTDATGDDWILAFEDLPNGDHDFNDAVFYIEDISAVPEPSTVVLFGIGLLGLIGLQRQRKIKKN